MTKHFAMHRPKPPARPAAKAAAVPAAGKPRPPAATAQDMPREIGGPGGPEPTRYGDWERNGICVDF